MKLAIQKWYYLTAIKAILRTITSCTILGKENLPDFDDGPYLIISNHFSYLEVPLICALLYNENFYGFASPDAATRSRFIAGMYKTYEEQIILIKRGQVDRKALQKGLDALRNDKWLLLFPEGGVTQESIEMGRQGKSSAELKKRTYSRDPAVLLEPMAGSAMLATQTNAKILPIGIWGGENVEGNLKRYKRTPLTMNIGKPIGPFTTPDVVRGRERRAYLDTVSNGMMRAIADLLPEQHRGPYS